MLGLPWNIAQGFRVSLEGRYYGTTNGGTTYTNNNIGVMLGLTYTFDAPEAAPPPPAPPAPQATSFMAFFDWDRSALSQPAQATIQQAAQAYKQKGTSRIHAPA